MTRILLATLGFYQRWLSMSNWLAHLVQDTADPSQLDRLLQRICYGVAKTSCSVPDFVSQHCTVKDAMRLLELFGVADTMTTTASTE